MIEVKNLDFYYKKGRRLFQNMSLSLGKGKIVGLLGRNGEGKSTLMKLLSGQLLARQGQAMVMGYDASKREAEFLQQVYILPEDIDLPDMKVGDYLSVFGAFYPTYDEGLAHKLVETFGISLEMKLKAMSLGQKKKAAIILALSLKTPLLLMDEPTNGLDIPSKSVFRRILAEHTTEEQTVIISTHQVRDLEQLIDHILLLEGSQIICNASISDLSDKLHFDLVANVGDRSNLLYSEPSMVGEYGVFTRVDDTNEGDFSMELFFNAMVSASPVIRQHLQDINIIG